MNPYDPQLSVAMKLDIWRQRADAYRAERDQARQEAKELREELETAEAEYWRHRANLDARYEKKADESRRRGQSMHGMSRLIRERNEEIKALKERIADMEPRLMPEGMEWPRYESGEPVLLGSMVSDARGGSAAAISFELSDDRVYIRDFEGFPSQVLATGERVKRPEADSWERIEDDATKQPYSYCVERGLDDDALPTNEKFARDLVRRCKALAGVSE